MKKQCLALNQQCSGEEKSQGALVGSHKPKLRLSEPGMLLEMLSGLNVEALSNTAILMACIKGHSARKQSLL